jgi:putative nucleotidyltransferase with HDIG domain
VGEFYAPNSRGWLLGIFEPLHGIGYHLYILAGLGVPRINATLPMVLVFAALLIGWLALRFGDRRLAQPFQAVLRAARAFEHGDLAVRIPPQPDAEFNELATSFNSAAGFIEESSRVQMLLATAQQKLAQAQSEEAALVVVSDFTRQILQGEFAVMSFPDGDDRFLPRTVVGDPGGCPTNIPISIVAGQPTSSCLGGAPLRDAHYISLDSEHCHPPENDENWEAFRQALKSHGISGMGLLPLTHQGVVLGLLTCYFDRRTEPDAVAKEAVHALALTAGAALHGLNVREDTILSLTAALEARDDETQDHALRVAVYAEHLAKELGITDPEELQRVRWGALLHDVGKIGLPDAILRKPGPLSEDEWQVVRRHPELGYRMIKHLEFLGSAREIVLCHHERFDGTGYPRGLAGDAIPLGSRIFAVVDTLDAITSDRPYRKALPFADAVQEIRQAGGGQFDPAVVEVFERVPEVQWDMIRVRAQKGFHTAS